MNFLKNKNILITGGTGSFGTKFTEIILKKYNPNKLVVFSRDELKQYQMAKKFPKKKYPSIRFFLGDVRDRDRLILATKDIDIIIHAAALKQVDQAEYNPFECIKTNIIGAENLIMASLHNKVSKVIALSTDKAVNPINLYGSTKLAADKMFIAANQYSQNNLTKFSVVRYGNVVGSRGSVIPLFKELIKNGSNHFPITDLQMTRFWITLEDAVSFVISSLKIMGYGEIFIPKMVSMKIADLAKFMDASKKIKVIGIRSGEKLHEVLISNDESNNVYQIKDRYIVFPSYYEKSKNWKKVKLSKVPKNFSYTSNNNTVWLNKKNFNELLKKI